MRIGLSILTHEGHNIWNNGIGQNVYHVACLLEAIPFVEKVILINTGDQNQPAGDVGDIGQRFPLVSLHEAVDLIDIVIEMSGGMDVEWLNRFRARGGKVVFHNCGQPYSGMIEPTIFNKPSFFSDPERCDEVWLLPKDAIFTPMMHALHRCPIHTVPYLWAPLFLEKTIADLDGLYKLPFGYKRGMLDKAKPAIFEPNISPIKMGTIPFMICEAAYSQSPERIEKVFFMNGHHMASQRTFIQLVERFDLYKDGKLTIAARDFFSHIMGTGGNMVVSHQIDCPQNYLYLDALFGNYPLIHNSPMFDDVGYYYPDSDITEGLAQFRLALAEHDANLDFHASRNARKIESLNPLNSVNRDAYAKRLLNLVNPNTKGQSR
jgi:hypothetical protein